MSTNTIPCITLTTDFGTRDYYLAAAKGSMLNSVNTGEQINIVDISHQIAPFNISEAAYILRNCYHNFPKGTVHCVSVDGLSSLDGHLALSYNDHFFICPDNGFISLMMTKKPDKIVRLDKVQSTGKGVSFPFKDFYPTAACHLARGGTLEFLGTPTEEYEKRLSKNAISQGDTIIGHVLYIDSMGRVICNIDKVFFENKRAGRNFNIVFSLEGNKVSKLSRKYSDVPEGEKLAFFNDQGLLEIAINRGANGYNGGASQLFGMTSESAIRIIFDDN